MKKQTIFMAVVLLLFNTIIFAEEKPGKLFDWSLLITGSWEPSSGENSLTRGNLHNRAELRLSFYPSQTPDSGLTLRGQVIDRRPINFDNFRFSLDDQDFERAVTHFQGGFYHKKTGSRLLYGALDEWGLSARIRNPWIRSPPYPENHKPLMADLKTAASSTKEDEAYLYLSTPLFGGGILPVQARAFALAQTETGRLTPAFAGGIDLILPKNTNLLIEAFYTKALLPPVKVSTWFSNPPHLPERKFHLYAAGVLFYSPVISISSDFALSETFAWGRDIYANFGILLTMPVPRLFKAWNTGRIERPLAVSLAADTAGGRFIFRDGQDHGSMFRTSAKIELKGARSSLIRFSTVLRGPGTPFAAGSISAFNRFSRSSTNFYYRKPASAGNSSFIRLTRLSVSADRNADNQSKIIDRFYGNLGFSLNLTKLGVKTPLGIALNGSVRLNTSAFSKANPYPVPAGSWNFEDCAFSGEFTFSPAKYQFKARFGYSNDAKNREIWDFSTSGAVRFKYGRLSLKISSPRLPDMWNFNISWRLELN